jgi:hypothetical protein
LAVVKPKRLSDELAALVETFGERPVRPRDIINVLHGRAYTLLLLLLALPFCTPIPLPGFSMPFGLIIAFLGFRLALDQRPWLPDRLLDMTLPPRFFTRLLRGARRLVQILETFLRPRLGGLMHARIFRHGCGVMILTCGLLLLLPLPIPFSNGLPALTVVLIAGAMLEEDGACLAAGLLAFVLTLSFYAGLAWGGFEGVERLRDWADLIRHDQ